MHTPSWPISETLIDLPSDMTDLKQTDVTAVPRFANVATFMRSQLRDTPEGLDIAMFGVPLDLGFVLSQRHTARAGTSARNVPSDT